MIRYDTHEEADMRLRGTVVLYKGLPHYVETVDERNSGLYIGMLRLPDYGEGAMCKIDDPDLSTFFSLGYVNYGGWAPYVQRLPSRRYKAGLNSENTRVWAASDVEKLGHRIGWNNLTRAPGILGMFTNDYPEFEEALEIVEQNRKSEANIMAFDRRFAIGRDPFRGDNVLFYRCDPVAFGTGRKFTLPDQFKYLKQVLNEKGMEVA